MKTLKERWENIVKKLKKRRNGLFTTPSKETATDQTQELSASSSKDFLKEPEENILIVATATEQQTPYPVVITKIAINTTTAESCGNSNITTIEDQNTPIADNRLLSKSGKEV